MTKKELTEKINIRIRQQERKQDIVYKHEVASLYWIISLIEEIEPTVSEVKEWCIAFQNKNKHAKLKY